MAKIACVVCGAIGIMQTGETCPVCKGMGFVDDSETSYYYPIREGELRRILHCDHIPHNPTDQQIIDADNEVLVQILSRKPCLRGLQFTIEQLELISSSLYFANNRLGKENLGSGKYSEEAAALQREINTYLKKIKESKG